MKQQKITKTQYNDALDFISHLILTKPDAVRRLLARFNIHFTSRPSHTQLINEVVNFLATNNYQFNDSLTKLISIHIRRKGDEMMVLDNSMKNSADNYDEFWGAIAGLAGKAIGGIAGMFGKKKKSGGGGAAAAIAAQQAATAARMKADMDAKMRQMQLDNQRRADERRRAEERRSNERRREAEANAKKKGGSSNVLMIGGIALGALAVVGAIIYATKKPAVAAQPQVILQKV